MQYDVIIIETHSRNNGGTKEVVIYSMGGKEIRKEIRKQFREDSL